ncbi:MAG: hypothetical protein GYA50_06330 [Eubacteriaceae bacterium]|nr:hypothetical protein [Eubacteriaceae bacterium]
MEGYLKWSKILNILFYVGIAADIALLGYIIYSKDTSNMILLGMLVVFTVAFKSMSKKMKQTYYENPDAEIVDVFELKYKADQQEKKIKQEEKAQRRNKL